MFPDNRIALKFICGRTDMTDCQAFLCSSSSGGSGTSSADAPFFMDINESNDRNSDNFLAILVRYQSVLHEIPGHADPKILFCRQHL